MFTGAETKVMMNATETPTKRSDVEKRSNPMIFATFMTQLICCLVLAIAGYLWTHFNHVWYLGDDLKGPVDILYAFLSAMLLLSYMIPIAIYVSMEIVKVAQGFFINWDVRMYDAETDTPAVARTSTLNEVS